MLFAVYGSLREGEFNYTNLRRWLGPESMRKVGEGRISDFALHSLGSYPAIVRHAGHAVKVELMECNDEASAAIDSMERGAGYSAAQAKLQDGRLARLYYKHAIELGSPVIGHGDWSRYLRERSNQ